jgi:hypothetical protein
MWVDNNKMGLLEIGWFGVDWVDLDQDKDKWRAHVNSLMNLRIPHNSEIFSSGFRTGGLLGSAQVNKVSWFSLS